MRGGVATPIGKQNGLTSAVLSADGSRAMYSNADGIWSLDVVSGQSSLLTSSSGGAVNLSTDGNRGLFVVLQNSQLQTQNVFRYTAAGAYWIDFRTGQQSSLGAVRSAATLSGDGSVAWLLQSDGRLTKVRVDTGEHEYISEALPGYTRQDPGPVPGSMFRFYGPEEIGLPPLARVTYFSGSQPPGLAAVVVAESPGYLEIQIPWNAPSGNVAGNVGGWNAVAFSVDGGAFDEFFNFIPTGSPAFETTDSIPENAAPYEIQLRHIKASHEDFRGLVTKDDPARPGEIVHIYMTGLGSVTPAQEDGVPAPVAPLAITDAPVTMNVVSSSNVYDQKQSQNAPVLFAGLVPGTVGLYQVDVMIPDTWPESPALRCDVPANPPTTNFPDAAFGQLDLAH